MDEPNRPVIIIGKRGGIENYQLLIRNEPILEGHIPSAYREKSEYAGFLTETSTKFATKLLDHNEQVSPGIANGFSVARSLKGLIIDQLEEIDYRQFELALRERWQVLSRERQNKPLTIGRALN